ncbi:Mut7-C RNAse domain-containing protein [Candidatus Omnitrophota bacterium]
MKFLVTPELGRLAKWLRILGFDAAYTSKANFSFLLIQALRDRRVILTRNARFIHKARVTRCVHVHGDSPEKQLGQVCRELHIKPDEQAMFSRCIICNTELCGVEKQKIKDRVPEYVYQTQDTFFTCPLCGRVYWQGTHWGNVARILKGIENGIHS